MAKIACVSFSIKYFTDGGVASAGLLQLLVFSAFYTFFTQVFSQKCIERNVLIV